MITMITTIDGSGRLVIPKEIRREADLEAGMPVEIRWRDGVIKGDRAAAACAVKFERKGHLLVARPKAQIPKLRKRLLWKELGATWNPAGVNVFIFTLDTNVMVAAVCAWHEHHLPALAEIETRLKRGEQLSTAALPRSPRLYAVLTRASLARIVFPPPMRGC